MKVTFPGYVPVLNSEVERLIFKFENARHRGYSLKRRSLGHRLVILRQLNREVGIPARYVSTAYDMVKKLPPHVTFGGKKTQQLRQSGKLSREEYRMRRNRILACRGEKAHKGNLCLRIVDGHILRVNIADKKWVKLPIQIPKKYMPTLRRAESYTVQMKRRLDMKGYDVKITVDAEEPEPKHVGRTMALDINSGHVDFAVVEKVGLHPVVFGKFNCHELLDANKGKKQNLLHRLTNKVGGVAKHYGADVVVGKLRSNHTNHRHRFNRRIQGMNQFEMRRILSYKLPLKGVGVSERSEAYTSIVGGKLAAPLGLDTHKTAAYAFAIKTLDPRRFWSLSNGLTFLHESCAYEGDGIPSRGFRGGSGLTVPHQPLTRLMCSELGIPLPGEATPNQGTGGPFNNEWPESSILQVKV